LLLAFSLLSILEKLFYQTFIKTPLASPVKLIFYETKAKTNDSLGKMSCIKLARRLRLARLTPKPKDFSNVGDWLYPKLQGYVMSRHPWPQSLTRNCVGPSILWSFSGSYQVVLYETKPMVTTSWLML
jgi:hypothetical protein